MKIVTFVLFLLCGFLVYDLFFGRNGIQQYKAVDIQLEQAKQQALYLQKRNQDVMDQINDLKQGSIAVEELARSELGLIKPNERFYRVLLPEDQIETQQINFN